MCQVKRTERGYAGHYCCSHRCQFRRNTLLQYKNLNVIISTVGDLLVGTKFEEIGSGRYYETMVFYGTEEVGDDGNIYVNADIVSSSGIDIYCNHVLSKPNQVIQADEMHENVVNEMCEKLLEGVI